MLGQTKSYNLKSQHYWDLPEPIAMKEIGIKVDYPALIQFAKDSGKKISELTKKEKAQFIISK